MYYIIYIYKIYIHIYIHILYILYIIYIYIYKESEERERECRVSFYISKYSLRDNWSLPIGTIGKNYKHDEVRTW